MLGHGNEPVVVNPLKPGEYAFFDEFHPEAKGKIVAK